MIYPPVWLWEPLQLRKIQVAMVLSSVRAKILAIEVEHRIEYVVAWKLHHPSDSASKGCLLPPLLI